MKRIVYIINALLFVTSCLMVSTTGPVVKQNSVNKEISYVNSEVIFKEIDVKEEEVLLEVEETVEENILEEIVLEDKEEVIVEEEIVFEEDVVDEVIKEETIDDSVQQDGVYVGLKFTGKMSGYGSDIGDFTASGYYIRETITYNDSTYGEVRIVAGGRDFPLGSIIKITNSKIGDFTAIVLDRGPNIGLDKKFTFDLLFKTSGEALNYGVSSNVNFEVLRMGY